MRLAIVLGCIVFVQRLISLAKTDTRWVASPIRRCESTASNSPVLAASNIVCCMEEIRHITNTL